MTRDVLNTTLDYDNIITKVMRVSAMKNESAIAKSLGITPQSLSIFKRQGKLPTGLVIQMALTFNISLDWLLTVQENLPAGNVLRKSTDHMKDEIINWLNDFWSRSTDDEKSWLKIQFERCFFEYHDWLERKARLAKEKK
ncbi:MAG: helix-turn-helix domain containing protein [Nitrospirae bacterium YQR-1]